MLGTIDFGVGVVFGFQAYVHIGDGFVRLCRILIVSVEEHRVQMEDLLGKSCFVGTWEMFC